ncbi:hypothetical protein R6Q59_023606 [Mikania micrantha]
MESEQEGDEEENLEGGAQQKECLQGIMNTLKFSSYSYEQAVDTAFRVLKEGKMDAIKLEGGAPSRISTTKHIVEAGIAVMGRVGLTPQATSVLGGFRPQGKNVLSAVKPQMTKALAGAVCLLLPKKKGTTGDVFNAIIHAQKTPKALSGAGSYCCQRSKNSM